MAHFVVIEGAQYGKTFPLDGMVLSIGSGIQCNIQLRDPAASRHHADLYRRFEGHYFLQDIQSKFGTTVDGRLLNNVEIELRDGARVKIGGTLLEFHAK